MRKDRFILNDSGINELVIAFLLLAPPLALMNLLLQDREKAYDWRYPWIENAKGK
jgi:hypothetical protein